ncbi:sigma-70 family RNA polymerase sigma factor [Pedococcus sp. KACC 23699]|uniref:Sigma-70 family RNA polymerase sigma factor n=1 Tax=Pedococcus sp. KACC 23699 TaxID=3149228 RepID=A0AAU7JNV1_9MICO
MHSVTDELVAAAMAGETGALRSIYEALAPRVSGYLRSHGSTDPEGLTQDVFLVLFQRLSDLTGGAAGLRTFTFSLAHARVVDELRARQRHPATVPYEPDTDRRTSDSAEVVAVRALDATQALALVDALNEGQRDVVLLRVVAGLSLEETATALGRSVGSVKQLQRRALLSLRSTAHERGVTP